MKKIFLMGDALRVAEKIKAMGIALPTALEASGGIRHSGFNGRVCLYSGQLPLVYEDIFRYCIMA